MSSQARASGSRCRACNPPSCYHWRLQAGKSVGGAVAGRRPPGTAQSRGPGARVGSELRSRWLGTILARGPALPIANRTKKAAPSRSQPAGSDHTAPFATNVPQSRAASEVQTRLRSERLREHRAHRYRLPQRGPEVPIRARVSGRCVGGGRCAAALRSRFPTLPARD